MSQTPSAPYVIKLRPDPNSKPTSTTASDVSRQTGASALGGRPHSLFAWAFCGRKCVGGVRSWHDTRADTGARVSMHPRRTPPYLLRQGASADDVSRRSGPACSATSSSTLIPGPLRCPRTFHSPRDRRLGTMAAGSRSALAARPPPNLYHRLELTPNFPTHGGRPY
jgi:hypothetical protein